MERVNRSRSPKVLLPRPLGEGRGEGNQRECALIVAFSQEEKEQEARVGKLYERSLWTLKEL